MRVRCYLPPEAFRLSTVELTGPQAHHLIHVLRVSQGSTITCFDGQGNEAEALIDRVTRKELFLRIQRRYRLAPCPWEIALGVAVPRGGKLDQIVDQATQLGVAQIFPLTTTRSVVKVSPRDAERKLPRLTQIAIEAGKQSGTSRLPKILPVMNFKPFLKKLEDFDLVLMATPQGPHERIPVLLKERSFKRVLLLIGPEGDFTPQEVDQAMEKGAHRICLGPSVLRVETAVVAGLSVVSFCLRDLF